jgi:hypothetical protein
VPCLEARGREATMAGRARGSSVADNSPESSSVSPGTSNVSCHDSMVQMPEVSGQPWEHRGGILVGFLDLRDRSHATPQLLQRRVYACRHILRLLHGEAVVDQPGELEVVAASTAGLVQFESVALGAAREDVGFIAVLKLLQYVWSAMVVPSSDRSSQVVIKGQASRNVCTYRSPPKQYLRCLAALYALEELVDNILCHFHVHGLHRRRLGLPGRHVAIRSPYEGNASRWKQCSRHAEVESRLPSREAVPRCEARTQLLSRVAMHMESTQALSRSKQCSGVQAGGCRRPSLRLWRLMRRWRARGVTEERTKDSQLGGGP